MKDIDIPIETELDPLEVTAADTETRKPRVALMGEFSAGKSTLANLLIGKETLPTKVTATQLPPVWIAYGDRSPYRIGIDGEEADFDLANTDQVSPADTQFIRVFCKSDVLEICDLIDMPGISDPNMPPEVWERVSHFADAVIWCTHATQAWRQSEAAVWETFPAELQENSMLLLTRFDKLTSERDRQRVARRVQKETEGLFRGVFPISLTQALDAGDDFDAWQASGANEFAGALVDVATALASGSTRHDATDHAADGKRDADDDKARVLVRPAQAEPETDDLSAMATVRITPRRVVQPINSVERSARPPRDDGNVHGL
ncbi:MAG: dynamin family protein [Rhodobacter sp.]|nr:dynamin family protein [Rhodobacter sp.]